MGVKRLYSYIREAFNEVELSSIKNKKIGVDGINYLYKIYFLNNSVGELDMHLSIIRSVEKIKQVFGEQNNEVI